MNKYHIFSRMIQNEIEYINGNHIRFIDMDLIFVSNE